MPNILSADQIGQMTRRMDELIALEGERAGKEVHQEAGTNRLSDLVNKDPIFEVCFTHPRVLAAINHVREARPPAMTRQTIALNPERPLWLDGSPTRPQPRPEGRGKHV